MFVVDYDPTARVFTLLYGNHIVAHFYHKGDEPEGLGHGLPTKLEAQRLAHRLQASLSGWD